MVDSIWRCYSDQRPTREDGDARGWVVARWSDGSLGMAPIGIESMAAEWTTTREHNERTGYVRPRKLHPAWRELRADSWEGKRDVWLYRRDDTDPGPFLLRWSTSEAMRNYFTHWQPCDPPPVWEGEL